MKSSISLFARATFVAPIFFSASVLLLTSCAPKASDKVGEAQLCIDAAVPGQAAACLDKITGIDTPAANTLRCSAGFIDEGFTQPARFKSAFDALSTGGTSTTQNFMSVLSFQSKGSTAANLASAVEPYGYCAKSGGKAFALLGSMASTATNLAAVVAAINPTPANIQTAISSLIASPGAPANAPVIAAIGGAIATTYTASCRSGTQADATLCTQLDTALQGQDLTNSSNIGLLVLNYWSTH